MKTRLAIGTFGVLVMGYAVFGILTDTGTDPAGQLEFLAVVLVAHDLLLLPIGIVVGALVARAVPSRYRFIIHSGLWATAIAGIISLPLAVGHPSSRSYPTGLLVVLAAIWLAAGVALINRRRRA